MRPLAFLLLAAPLLAEPILTLTGPATIAQGQSATLTLILKQVAQTKLAAVEWTVTLPAGLTLSNPVISTTQPSMGIYLGNAGIGVVVGATNSSPPLLGNQVLADGAVATITVQASTSAPLGPTSLPLTALAGASQTATSVSVSAGAVYSPTITPNPCAYLGGPSVTYQEVEALIQALIGNVPCSSSFAPGCTVTALQAVLLDTLPGNACLL